MIRHGLCSALAVMWIATAANADCENAVAGAGGPIRFVRPLAAEFRMTLGFGFRTHPLLQIVREHPGIDFPAPAGTPVQAVARGEILEARRNGEYGNYVLVRHGNGAETEYAHLSRIAASSVPGTCVEAGHVIGFVGSTGLATGAHLHLGMRVGGLLVDPVPHIEGLDTEKR